MGTSLLSAGQYNSQDTPTLCSLGLGDICWSGEDFSWRKVMWFYSLLCVSLAVSKSLLPAPSPTLSLGLNSPGRGWIFPESGEIPTFFLFWFIFPKVVSMLSFKFFHALFPWWEQDARRGEGCWWWGDTTGVKGEVPLLSPASPWTLGSSSFSLDGLDSASSAFLFLGDELPQELVEGKGFEPCSVWESGYIQEILRSWQKRPKNWSKSPDEGGGQGWFTMWSFPQHHFTFESPFPRKKPQSRKPQPLWETPKAGGWVFRGCKSAGKWACFPCFPFVQSLGWHVLVRCRARSRALGAAAVLVLLWWLRFTEAEGKQRWRCFRLRFSSLNFGFWLWDTQLLLFPLQQGRFAEIKVLWMAQRREGVSLGGL